MKSTKILKVRIDNSTYKKSIQKIDKFVKTKRPHQICTVNPEYIMNAQEDDELLDILNKSDLNTPDGGGILFAANYLGTKLDQQVTGIDLIDKICILSQKKGYKLFLLGGFDNVAKKSSEILRKRYPGINIVGTYEGKPYIKPISKKLYKNNYAGKKSIDLSTKNPIFNKTNFDIIKKITKTKPDILLVAYGCPKQDKFIARHKKYLNVPVMIGIGGSLDFIAGKAKRAPKWMRTLRLEWLYRLIKQPKVRLNRIITAVIKFPWTVITKK